MALLSIHNMPIIIISHYFFQLFSLQVLIKGFQFFLDDEIKIKNIITDSSKTCNIRNQTCNTPIDATIRMASLQRAYAISSHMAGYNSFTIILTSDHGYNIGLISSNRFI